MNSWEPNAISTNLCRYKPRNPKKKKKAKAMFFTETRKKMTEIKKPQSLVEFTKRTHSP